MATQTATTKIVAVDIFGKVFSFFHNLLGEANKNSDFIKKNFLRFTKLESFLIEGNVRTFNVLIYFLMLFLFFFSKFSVFFLQVSKQEITTIFVGNITDKASDTLIRQILMVGEDLMCIVKLIFYLGFLLLCMNLDGSKCSF